MNPWTGQERPELYGVVPWWTVALEMALIAIGSAGIVLAVWLGW